MLIVKLASKAVEMARSGIQCVLSAALLMGDVVSNMQNNILKRETRPLFPVFTVVSNSHPCLEAANFYKSLGLNVSVLSLAKHPNTRVKFSRFYGLS